jgi:hypothetical protein
MTTMADPYLLLIDAVTRRIALAEAATPGPWRWRDLGGQARWQRQGLVGADNQVVVPSGVPDVYPSYMDADHITANSPAAMLPLLRADLELIEKHQPKPVWHGAEVTRYICEYCGSTETKGDRWCWHIANRLRAYQIEA